MARQGAAKLGEDSGPPGHDRLDGDDDAPWRDDPEAAARAEARQARRAAGEANRARLRSEAEAAIARSSAAAPKPVRADRRGTGPVVERQPLTPRKLPDPKRQLRQLLGDARGGRAWTDLNRAAEHLDAGRAEEARKITQRLYQLAPEVVEVAELHGLSLYGVGRWRPAIDVLEDVRESSGLPDQNPVLADAHRALGNFADVAELWDELRAASPASEVLTEGRIVAAGALADQGRLRDAVALLQKGFNRPKRPFEHHIRRAYALADLLERAGEGPAARELFGWVDHHVPGYLDAKARSASRR